MKGTVKRFSSYKYYGFIIGDDGLEYFFHGSEMSQSLMPEEGMTVEFEPYKAEKGLAAKNVQAI